jgi:hypothetical protein
MKRNGMGWHVARVDDVVNSYKIAVGKREEKTKLGRPTSRCENIKIDAKWKGMDKMTAFRVLVPSSLVEGLRKTMKSAGLQADIWARYHLNTEC